MMPVLIAEESQRAVDRLRVGTGVAPEDFQRRVLRTWERERTAGLPPPAVEKATPSALAAIGVGYRLVPVKPKESGVG